MALTSSLASHLNNPNWRVAAILSINEQQFSVLLPHLIDSLLDADDGVRWAAVIALGRFQRRDMAPMLIPLLDDSSKWVRAATARILGESRVVEAVPHLIKRLCDSDSLARAAAARALGLIGHPSAISGLNGLLSDTERLWDDCGERICNVARQSLQLIYRHLDAIQAALNRGEQIPSDQMERWMSHQLEFGAAREEPVEADPDAPAVLAELPGWLKEQTPAGSDLDNIFAVTGEEFPAAPAVPESTEEAPDPWAEALEYERQHDVSEVPDWYARNITDPDRIAAVNS
ncbi:MAG: HEAT repeat domain-containing protein, partial [Chloroflexi bacterium]|nr:HEAT repeat domain-containing protein [Chloroflexota bacterium]MDL1884824.1 HEAT repeat domain-containing protein [Anaerolineae bacterium CFX8]